MKRLMTALSLMLLAGPAMASGALDEVWWDWMVRLLQMVSGGIWNY